jgi:hypothetical protein
LRENASGHRFAGTHEADENDHGCARRAVRAT